METDGEVKEERGNHFTTYFRQYDPRLGRWWSNDPVVQPGESPYAAIYNNPILFSDPLGNDPGDPTGEGSGTEPIMPGGGSGTEPQQPQPPIRDDPISRRSLVSVYYNDGFPYEGDGSEHLLGPNDTWMYHQDERSAIRAVIVTTHQSGDISVFQFDRWRRWWYRIYTGPVSEANLLSARPPYSLYDEMANNTFVILFTTIPVAGDVMDLALGVIAAVEGRWADAVLGHFLYWVPLTDLIKILKLIKIAKSLENGTDAIKVFENSTEIAEGKKLAEMSQGSVGKGEGVAGPSREELANLPQVKTDNSAQTSGTVTGAQLLENTAARGFSLNRHGELTNGIYTVSKEAMKPHVVGGVEGKSIFYPTLNADEAVLKAAQYADEAGLWVGNKAKVPVVNTNVGTLGNGQPTNIINVYRNANGYIHGSPGS